MHLALHTGKTGKDGATRWNPLDLSTNPKAGWIPAVKTDLLGFELVPQKVAEVFYPGEIKNIGTGNANGTMAAIDIPPARGLDASAHKAKRSLLAKRPTCA